MTKKYIIIVNDDINAESEDKITRFFQAKKANFWHWVHNVWIVVSDNFSLIEIRESIRLIHSGTVLVFRMDDGKLSGYAPAKSGDWLREYWNEGKRYTPDESD
ncbi:MULTISPECIES: hypothetical protein [Gallibacterium]|uniref:Uncharacterized protein n=1 Tax=Gallibacterium anatis TaxID=750 RepID=A0A0A2XXG7_9PAST|nr:MULTISPECIES: hypothetical protein [Gallibacterium]KGQ29859.1 hypothetical protein JP32_10170 [Gallibacterium anatis]KGQ37667.1 hypothetical protein JP35_09315 [Gallibacterium anatis]MDA3979008.1 hypothetical protein [Gallibacterium sp. AGMB14963]